MTHLESVGIRIADSSDSDRILAAYERWKYKGGVGRTDTVWIAENTDELIGAVRIVPEHGTLVLRGMRIADPWRSQGIGSQMLSFMAAWLGERECYCIPYVHLVKFYARAGFVEVAPASAPSFLAERMADYRRRGLNVTIMCRCPLKSECATDVSPFT
jgi:GNAT superfamily N-acetyltransferase